MLSQNFYASLALCLEKYPFYSSGGQEFFSQSPFLRNFFSLCSERKKALGNREPLWALLVGGKDGEDRLLAHELYRREYQERGVVFRNLLETKVSKQKDSFFIFSEAGKLKKNELFSFLKDDPLEKDFSCFVVSSDKAFDFPFHVKISIDSFYEKSSYLCSLISYFLSLLQPCLALSQEAFSYCLKGKPFRSCFEVKYTLLWAHHEQVREFGSEITLKALKKALTCVRVYKKEFLMLEEVDLNSLSFLMKRNGFKRLMSFVSDLLMEKTFLESGKSYTKSSLYTHLPVSTLRSKRLKYMRTSLT